MTYPSGALIAYARSGTTGRVSSVSFQPHAGGPVTAIASGFTWQPFGALTGYFAGNGSFHWRQYTLNGAPETVNGPGLASTYGVDVLGNITTLTSGARQQYRYDAIQRLTRVETASLQRIDAWTYDGTGNRLSRQAGQGPLLTLSYPPTSHRVSVAGVARSYDANGNTTARGSESLFYGDHNRLVTWSSAFGMSNASYQHNARGERVWKQSMAGAASMGGDKLPPECLAVQGLILQSFLYDEAGRVIVDRNDPCSDGPLTNFEFVWLDDQPLAVIDAAPNLPSPQLVGHITSDHLHTPRAISNAAGTVTWTWAPVSGNSTSGGSNVFGERPAQANGAPFNTRAFNLRLPGQYLDAESGLHYNYFRDYEPGTGRYVQSDPIGLEGGISTYGYAGKSPLIFTDPTGLDYWIENADPSESGGGFHQSVCVGKHGTRDRYCVSFGRKPGQGGCYFDCNGHVYVDRSPEASIDYPNFRGTSPDVDRQIRRFLRSLVGQNRNWDVLFGENCRVFSQTVFEELEERFGGKQSPTVDLPDLPRR